MFLITVTIIVNLLLVQSCEKSTFNNVHIKASKYLYLLDEPDDITINGTFTGCITKSQFEGVLQISIRNESIPILYEGTVQNLEWLHDLTLENNGIVEIKPGAFQKLPTLSMVNLAWNKIKTIPSGVFSGMSIRRLLLNQNNIGSIAPGALDNMENLTKIDLSNNELKEWNSMWFTNSPNVVSLYVSFNEIEALPAKAFSNFKGIQNRDLPTIFLANNKIKKVDISAFEGLKELEFLDLDNNNITELNKNVFSHFKRINNLMLNNNQMTCWPDAFLNSLPTTQIIALNGNPLDCACLKDMKNWAKSHTVNIRLSVRSIECMKIRIEETLEYVRNIKYDKL